MKTTIKLKNPIKVDGKEVKELPFDTDVFGMDELDRANKKYARTGNTGVMEVDFAYHSIVARIVIEKSSKGKISYEDLSRLSGADTFILQRAGRDFLLESAEGLQESTEVQSEPTVESTEQE
jgi:hypothetical protein